MKLTKLVHACLLVEEEGKTALIDPGVFSRQAVLDKLAQLNNLNYLIITHNHADHLDEEVVDAVAKKFPQIQLAANAQINQQLSQLNLTVAGDDCFKFNAPHEPLPAGEVPDNSGWHFGHLSHPGDSLSFNETRDILALPYVAPWGSTTQAVQLALKLQPKFVVPIHDWHLSEEARGWYAGLLERALAPADIKFVDLPMNQLVEI